MIKNYFVFLVTTLFLLSTGLAKAQQPQEVGQWSDRIPFGLVPVAVANLPDGRLLTWSSRFSASRFDAADGATYFEIFDPNQGANGTALGLQITPNNHNMFCPGINNLSDGRILVAGGGSAPRTTIYDPQTEIWTPAQNMNVARAYQGNVTLANGEVFTIGGQWDGGSTGKIGEIWTAENGWKSLPGIPMEVLFNNNDLIGGHNRPADHAWVWGAPNGKVFHAGPSEDMHWLDINGNGSVTFARKRANDVYSISGTTVMYDIGKILKVGGSISYGGGAPASETSYVIDINNENNVLVTRTANDIAFSRTHHNSVVLPNGEVLIVGGLSTARTFFDGGSRFQAEIWNPQTNRWRTAASMQVPRNYHSVSILMMDGRVFSAGGGLCGGCTVNHEDAEIYSPPYLFDSNGNLASRPEISAPETALYNQTLQVQSSDNIQAFSFIRMSSATHSINNEQRRVPVSFSRNGNTYALNVPGANVMPPGYYMLFAMDQNGVPSIAEAVQVLHGAVSVTDVEVNPTSLELAEGRIASLTATVLPSNASNKSVLWSSGNTDVATVDADGNVTAVGVGTTTITITTDDGGFTAQTIVTVVEGDGLCIANGTILMERYDGILGATLQTLFNSPNYPDNPSSTQELSSFEIPTNVADNYGVRVSGYLCAPETGTYYFWVAGDDESRLNLSTDNDTSNIATIANVPDWTSPREWNKYSNQKSVGIQLVQGLSYYIEAFVKEIGGGDNLAVGWRKPSDGNGSTPVEVIPGSVLSTTIQVAPINVTGVTVEPTSLDLMIGDSAQLTSTFQPADADDTTVAWNSSDEDIAIVDNNGQVTAIGEGVATITVTTNDGGFQATSTIMVEREPVLVTGVTLNVSTLDLVAGETANLIATVSPSNADDTTVVWSSNDDSIVLVDENGQVTAVSEGTATITVRTSDGDFEAQVEVIVSPLQVPRPTQSSPIIVDADTRRVWAVNPDNNTVSVIDADTFGLIGEFTVAADPVGIAKDSQGDIWVTCRDAGVIQVLNPQGSVQNTINLGRGSQPYAVVNDPAGEYLYVTLFASNKVLKINAASRTIADEIPVFARPRAMAITTDGSRLLVTQFITENSQGKIARINLNDFTLDSNVDIEADTFSPNTSLEAKGVANYLGGIAIQPESDKAWFTAKKDNILTGSFRSGENLDFATTIRAFISTFSIDTGQENVVERVDIDNHNLPTGITMSPSGDYVFITMLTNNRIIVLDANNGLEVLRRDVGFAPSGIVVDPTTNRVFVKNFLSRSVHVFDANDLITQGNRTMSLLSEVGTVSNELLSNQVLQGKQIFYNARDSRMTVQENADAGYISCASCHIDGTHDGQTWDFTQRGEGLRNTISLRGRAGTAHGNVHWTGNFDEIHDFEGDIRFAFGGTGFMNDQDFFSENRENPLGGSKAGRSPELDALNAYIESLNSFDESPNKNENGTMTSAALQGRALFNSMQCANCHSGQTFTNSPSGLLHDIGTLAASSGLRLGRTLQGLDVPTLRDVWATAPYLHDGSAATVSEAISRHATATNLSQNDLDLLEAYVLQLDGLEAPAPEGINFELQVPSTASLGESVALSVLTNIPNLEEVIYYAGDIEIGRSSTAPYNLNFLPEVANNYCIYAKAVHQGMATISQNQTLTITGSDGNPGENGIISLEGEDFVLVENGSVGNYIPGFQGTGFLDMGASSSFGEWQFQNNVDGTATLTIVYSNGHLANRSATIAVNGNSVGEIEFIASPNYFNWQSIQLGNIDLQEGLNTIRITTTSSFGGVDIDYLNVELPTQPVTSVALNPGTLDLTEGESGQLTATVSPSDASDKSITWSSSDDGIATVDNDGNVTANAPGTATIMVTTNDGGFQASATVEVNELLTAVTGVSLNTNNLVLVEGEVGSLTETVIPVDASDQSVTWSSSDDGIASADNAGNITANAPGTATITVTTNDGGFQASATVEVSAISTNVTGVTLSPEIFSIAVGESRTLNAEVLPSNASNKDIIWYTSDDSVASINDTGEVTALAEGTSVLTARTVDGGFEAYSTLTVFAGGGTGVAVTGVTLEPEIFSMAVGESQELNAVVLPSNADNKAIIWYTSDDSVASINDNGEVTALAEGSSVLTARTVDGGFEAYSTLTVFAGGGTGIAVTGVTLEPEIFSMAVGESQALNAVVLPSNADNKALIWYTSDDSVASISDTGEVTALAEGSSVLTARTVDGGFEAYSSLTVFAGGGTGIAVTGVTLQPESLSMAVGESRSMDAGVIPSNADNRALIWYTSDGSVASISSSGEVTALGEGTSVLTARTVDGGFEAYSVVTVISGGQGVSVTGVTLEPELLSIAIGETIGLTATITPSNADNKNLIWYTSDPNVASISSTGELTAVGEGVTVITARTVDGGFEAYSTVTSVDAQPGALSIVLGELAQQDKVVSNLRVAPNPIPTNSLFSVSFVAFVNESYTVELWDYNGRLVKSDANTARIGWNLIDLESVNISAGNYIVTVRILDDVLAKQLILK